MRLQPLGIFPTPSFLHSYCLMIHLRRVESFAIRLRGLTRSYSSTPRLRQKEGWDDKLRILLCGTDEFSIESLKALHHESRKTKQIESIDVLTKKDKAIGRGSKKIYAAPIKKTAIDLKLPLHQIDTFTGWSPPDINLIIAVSFGLLIPPRILDSSRFAGLNVHPSLLPDLRGAAPTQWAIILGRPQTGVSLQTLHPTKFDEGVVLAQTPGPFPIDDQITESALADSLAPVGAKLLVEAIRNRLYLPPYHAVIPLRRAVSLAPKIKMEDKIMDFQNLSSNELCQRWRALGPLHAFAEDVDGKKLRVKCGRVHSARNNYDLVDRLRYVSEEERELYDQTPIGVPFACVSRARDVMFCHEPLIVKTKDGAIKICDATVEGKLSGSAAQRAAQAKLFGTPIQLEGVNEWNLGWTFYSFLKPLTIE